MSGCVYSTNKATIMDHYLLTNGTNHDLLGAIIYQEMACIMSVTARGANRYLSLEVLLPSM